MRYLRSVILVLLVLLIAPVHAWSDPTPSLEDQYTAEITALSQVFGGDDCDAIATKLEAYDFTKINDVAGQLRAKYSTVPLEDMPPMIRQNMATLQATMHPAIFKTCSTHKALIAKVQSMDAQFETLMFWIPSEKGTSKKGVAKKAAKEEAVSQPKPAKGP